MKAQREEIGKAIADNIRAERNRANLSQENVANQLGITLRTYVTYEQNAKNVEATTLILLSKILECDVIHFYFHTKSTKCE